jgi:hypothetical protein
MFDRSLNNFSVDLTLQIKQLLSSKAHNSDEDFEFENSTKSKESNKSSNITKTDVFMNNPAIDDDKEIIKNNLYDTTEHKIEKCCTDSELQDKELNMFEIRSYSDDDGVKQQDSDEQEDEDEGINLADYLETRKKKQMKKKEIIKENKSFNYNEAEITEEGRIKTKKRSFDFDLISSNSSTSKIKTREFNNKKIN